MLSRLHQAIPLHRVLPRLHNSCGAKFWFLSGLISILLVLIFLSGCAQNPQQSGADEILFLGWDEEANTQLFQHQPQTGQRQLTAFEGGIYDYALSANGRLAIISVINENGHELWAMDTGDSSINKLYECPDSECSNFSWHADSRRLLFEQRPLDSKGFSGTPTLYWLDTTTGEVRLLFREQASYGSGGRLSPSSPWISFHSPLQEGTVLYDLEDGRSHFILNEGGRPAAWSPDGSQVILPQDDLVIIHGDEGDDHEAHEHDYRSAVHLLLIDPETGEQRNISGDLQVDDSTPAWSPDGQWVAFGRRPPRTDAARQLWLVRSDGSEARTLTDDPAVNHGPPSWSADGQYLLFQQISQTDTSADPEVWRLNVETGQKEKITASGMQPSWLVEIK